MTLKETEQLPQWYMDTHSDDRYDNIHEGAKRNGNEFGVQPGPNVIQNAMLERALHQSDLLPDARTIVNAINSGLPEMQFMNTVLRFGHEMVCYDAYEPQEPTPWPKRADEITVYTKMKHPDGVHRREGLPARHRARAVRTRTRRAAAGDSVEGRDDQHRGADDAARTRVRKP